MAKIVVRYPAQEIELLSADDLERTELESYEGAKTDDELADYLDVYLSDVEAEYEVFQVNDDGTEEKLNIIW